MVVKYTPGMDTGDYWYSVARSLASHINSFMAGDTHHIEDMMAQLKDVGWADEYGEIDPYAEEDKDG